MKRKKTDVCFSCGGEYISSEGPVHRYMDSSPGCWAAFGSGLNQLGMHGQFITTPYENGYRLKSGIKVTRMDK